jgi:hypothetical protein
MTKDEALKLALEALEHAAYCVQNNYCPDKMGHDWDDTIASIKEALAKSPLPVQEPEYWNVIDPAGNVVASETDAIRGWARIAGSYEPTVEGLLWLHEQGWRVLPKVTPPLPVQRPWVGLTDEDITKIDQGLYPTWKDEVQAIEAKLKEKNT